MKHLLIVIALFLGLNFLAQGAVPAWHEIKKTPRGTKMLKIAQALWKYDSDFGKFPPTLFKLVSSGKLVEADLMLSNTDGSISVPTYFPNLTVASKADSVVLKNSSKDGSYVIIVRLDLSIVGLPKNKPKPNK